MKSYGHLWEKFISDDNVKLAIHNYAKGKRKRREVRAYLADEEAAVEKLRDIAEHYKNARHVPKEIYDGITRKKRTIIVPKAHEQVVHHMIVNVLSPIIMHGMYEHSNGSIPGRGAHRGKKAIEHWLHHQTRNVKYCLKMDIRKFFDSIPHEILIAKLEKIIRDERFMALLREIISVTDKGLPLGFYTSQWLANWYLQDLDHFIKEDLGAPHYIRYMDDMVIFGPNKKKLHRMREEIDAYLRRELGLELKDNWQVFRYSYKDEKGNDCGRDLDFMGFRFFRDRTVLRRHIMLKASRKARRIGIKKKHKEKAYALRDPPDAFLCRMDQTHQIARFLSSLDPAFCKFKNTTEPAVKLRQAAKGKGGKRWIGSTRRARSARRNMTPRAPNSSILSVVTSPRGR